jgi:hypothetical protein
VSASATGSTTKSATIVSAATAPTTAAGDIALGFYADSGFGINVAPGSGWTGRSNTGPNGVMELAGEDQNETSGASPAASFGTSAKTTWLASTVAFRSTAAPVTVPAAPTSVSAAPGNASATLSWTPPSNGGSPITGYTISQYQAGTLVGTSTAPASVTRSTISNLTNGASYNFAISATNSVGAGPLSTLSNTVVPVATVPAAYVQSISAQAAGKASLGVTPSSALTSGNRLVVEVGVWNAAHSKATAVTDTSGDSFSELLHFTASDGTELSVWSAAVGPGVTTRPTITATAGGKADIGVAALEYSGLASADPVVDVSASATGTTAAAQPVSSGSTTATRDGSAELSLGFYADSGFGKALGADPGYSPRVNLSPNGTMDLLVQDAIVTPGATPAPSVATGAGTVWLAATVVFRAG